MSQGVESLLHTCAYVIQVGHLITEAARPKSGFYFSSKFIKGETKQAWSLVNLEGFTLKVQNTTCKCGK